MKQQVDDNNAIPESGDDASMFDQLIALWGENKIAIENMVTNNTKNLDPKEIILDNLLTKLKSKYRIYINPIIFN